MSIVWIAEIKESSASIHPLGQQHHLGIELPGQLAVAAKGLGDDPKSPGVQEVILTIDAVVNAPFIKGVPQVSRRRDRRDHSERIAVVPTGICGVAQPFEKRARVSAGGEAMAQDADLAVGVVVIKRDEVLSQVVAIWRYVLAKQRKSGIVIAFGQIAQNLIVRSIFSDDIEDMVDRQFGAALRAVKRRTFLDLPGPGCEVSL